MAAEIPLDTAIRAFWDWFATISAELASRYAAELALQPSDRVLLAALDERVSALGAIKWEVGPGKNDRLALVISPDGEKERLPATRRIVSLAPEIDGWEFHFAKPPKIWSLRFSIERDGKEVSYDARPWRYVLYEFPDGSFDIVVEQNNVAEPDVSDMAAVIVVVGVLGEEARIEHFGDVEAVRAVAEELESKASSLEHLAEHMRSLLDARRTRGS